jgi:TatD DNase family protein
MATTFPSKKKEKFEQGWLVKDRNEPCTIRQVFEVVAAVRGADPDDLAAKVLRNTKTLFFPELRA